MTGPIEQFRTELEASPISGRSPDGWVQVGRDRHGEISVRIEPGAFRSLSHRQLTDEIRGALTAAVADYSRISDRLFQRWGGAW
ncbi:hypothetical protein GCM10010172_50850 [Paractinoplanes ferrugineus]|uniref:Uncharacterized protein n=1 Tax=Paractinoplanes ferrugineus TaxID=113564 RepID=A0A919MQ93_9ACTN|nr:hypothetical protein [Actinoplanes ferrugineus]GIE16097.1 hypothetical protein Afe05nite_79370 [Actinoplanes ferrugineus]